MNATTTTPHPSLVWELEGDELLTDLNENDSNLNEINACNTQKFKNELPSNKLAFIIRDSMVKNVDGYLLTGSLNRNFIVKVRPFSSAKTSGISDYILNPRKRTSILIMSYTLEQTTLHYAIHLN